MSKISEFIILPKKLIEDRIKELESYVIPFDPYDDIQMCIRNEVDNLRELLNDGKELLPIIEKAFDAGKKVEVADIGYEPYPKNYSNKREFLQQDIENL